MAPDVPASTEAALRLGCWLLWRGWRVAWRAALLAAIVLAIYTIQYTLNGWPMELLSGDGIRELGVVALCLVIEAEAVCCGLKAVARAA